MFETQTITLKEGIKAALVISIILAYSTLEGEQIVIKTGDIKEKADLFKN